MSEHQLCRFASKLIIVARSIRRREFGRKTYGFVIWICSLVESIKAEIRVRLSAVPTALLPQRNRLGTGKPGVKVGREASQG